MSVRTTRKRRSEQQKVPDRSTRGSRCEDHVDSEEGDLLDLAVAHYSRHFCLERSFVRLSECPSAAATVAMSPLCFLVTDPLHSDVGPRVPGSDAMRWCGAALCRLTETAETTPTSSSRAETSLTLRCDLSALVLRVQFLTRLTAALLTLVRTAAPPPCVVPFHEEGERVNVSWATCRAARALLESVRGGEGVALLYGFPRVQLEAFAPTLTPQWCADRRAPNVSMADEPRDERADTAARRHVNALRPLIPPAFASLVDTTPEAWYLVRFPGGCPSSPPAPRQSVAHFHACTHSPPHTTDMSCACAERAIFVLPSSLLVAYASLQIGEKAIPPAHRVDATRALADAVAHANRALIPMTRADHLRQGDDAASRSTVTFHTYMAQCASPAIISPCALRPASSLMPTR